MSYPEYPTQSIECAVWPCDACENAGRTSWRSRVEWHTEKLRRRARLRRLALRAAGALFVIGLAVVLLVVSIEWVLA